MMKPKRIFNILFSIVACLMLSSCNDEMPVDFRFKTFDETIDEIKTMFMDTKYSDIRDEWIVSEKFVKTMGTGKIVNVTWKYGETVNNTKFYVDQKGNNVRIKKTGGVKASSYPASDEAIWDITCDGNIILDIYVLVFGLGFIILAYLCIIGG